jgi:competence protein ComGF
MEFIDILPWILPGVVIIYLIYACCKYEQVLYVTISIISFFAAVAFIGYCNSDKNISNTTEFSNVSTNVSTPLLNNDKNLELSGQVIEQDDKLIIKWDKKDGYDHHGDGIVDIIKKEGNKYTVRNDKGTVTMIKSSDNWTIEKEGVYIKLRK